MSSPREILQDKKIELQGTSFVKTVLMLIIVLYHSIVFWGGSWFTADPAQSAAPLKAAAEWMNSFHIYAFALVSGYLFYYLKCECGKYSRFLPFIANKAKRLLIPYLFVLAVWVVPIQYAFFRYGLTDFFRRFVLGENPNQLWFLLMLFWVFVIFWLLASFFDKHLFLGVLVALAFYGVGFFAQSALPNILQIPRACLYVPFFYIGFILRKCGTALVHKIPLAAWLAADILLFIGYRYLSSQRGTIFTVLRLPASLLLYAVGAVLAFTALSKLGTLVSYRSSKIYGFFSSVSMPVYLLHQQLIYLPIYLLNGILNPYGIAAINFVFSLALSLVLSALLMKFKATRFLIGEK